MQRLADRRHQRARVGVGAGAPGGLQRGRRQLLREQWSHLRNQTQLVVLLQRARPAREPGIERCEQ
jgi:hypothetical protein